MNVFTVLLSSFYNPIARLWIAMILKHNFDHRPKCQNIYQKASVFNHNEFLAFEVILIDLTPLFNR